VADGDDLSRLRHDLRSPLTVVIGFAELMAADRPMSEDQRRDYSSRVLDAAVEMRDLLEEE
jgi:signal transduction histidine kinase